ncbi:MAG: hypothetical protein Q8K58_05230 [Acidimicrobiales bacterium]|nr:hypothetical protein [Acidimicrobiales bacterium]
MRAALEPALETHGYVHEVGDGERDVGLRELAEAGAALLALGDDELAEHLRWTSEDGAFGIGLEGFLQTQVMFALQSRPQPEPVVVRIVRGMTDVTRTLRLDSIHFLMVSAEFVDLLARIADAWAYALAWHKKVTAEHGPDDPLESHWTRTNVLGGRDLEILTRGKGLGFSYLAVDRFQKRVASWRTFGEDVDEKIDHVQQMNDDLFVLGPLQYALFHEWGLHLMTTRTEEDKRFWREVTADIHALDLFDRAMNPADYGAGPASHPAPPEAIVAYSVYLQARRLHRFDTGVPELIRGLCLPSVRLAAPPPLGRLGRTEVQMRLATIAPFLGSDREDVPTLLIGVNDEMQVFYGLVIARTLIRLGGTAYLESLCGTDWTEVMEFLKDGAEAEFGEDEVARVLDEVKAKYGSDPEADEAR